MNKIPTAVEKRLPLYYRHIKIMAAEGREKTTSAELAKKAGNTAIQVRQDIFSCGGTENYHIDNLEKWFAELLGLNEKHRMIVIGAGNLGRAIMSYKDFEKEGFFIDAAFDNNLAFEGMNVGGIPILNINTLGAYLSESIVDIAVIATPVESAKKIADKLIKYGIKGIWNFSPCDLEPTEECAIKNLNLTDSLMTLSFQMRFAKQ